MTGHICCKTVKSVKSIEHLWCTKHLWPKCPIEDALHRRCQLPQKYIAAEDDASPRKWSHWMRHLRTFPSYSMPLEGLYERARWRQVRILHDLLLYFLLSWLSVTCLVTFLIGRSVTIVLKCRLEYLDKVWTLIKHSHLAS